MLFNVTVPSLLYWMGFPMLSGLSGSVRASSNSHAIPQRTRDYWIREAVSAVTLANNSPCPFEAFGAVVVNHTNENDLGQLICTGANTIAKTGNPTLHGEIAAINNCTEVLTDPNGLYKLSASEAAEAMKSLSLYTTGEPCPMCASAIRWGGFKECIYATTTEVLIKRGWPQIDIPSAYVFRHSSRLKSVTELVGEVLVNETDPLFAWQFDPSGQCPTGCHRSQDGKACQRE